MVFGWLKRFRKKEEEEDIFPQEVTTPLPEDLEKFRMSGPEPIPQRPIDLVGETERGIENKDRLDLILQKLETIDVRLKLLEEKLGV
jgi:hypothetical protein